VRGISEIVASILLVVVSLALLAIALPIYFNLLNAARSALAAQGGAPRCSAEIVAVANESGNASIALYNYGTTGCQIQYALCLTAMGDLQTAGSTPLVYRANAYAPPASLLVINTTLPYNSTLCPRYAVVANGERIST
jgi:hypothetical protein